MASFFVFFTENKYCLSNSNFKFALKFINYDAVFNFCLFIFAQYVTLKSHTIDQANL